MKFSSTFRGLMTELKYNLNVLSDIKELLKMDAAMEKEGSQALITFPKPHKYAFNYFIIEGHLLKLPEKYGMKLSEIYRELDIINMYLDHYIETKYGILFVTNIAPQIREALRTILLERLIPAIEKHIKELLDMLATYNPRFTTQKGSPHIRKVG
ncbi:MAG: hypothetical protein QXQ57_04785 [Sulfolobales archaeon]